MCTFRGLCYHNYYVGINRGPLPSIVVQGTTLLGVWALSPVVNRWWCMPAMGVWGVFGHMPQAAQLHCTIEWVSSGLVKAPGKPSQWLVLSLSVPSVC